MANYRQIAEQALSGSPIMQGREKISVADLIARYPNGVTVNGFDLISKGDDKTYAVFTFAEDPTRFFNGGALATKVAFAWVAATDGDVEAASAGLAAEGGVKFKMYKKATKDGRTVTAFDPVN